MSRHETRAIADPVAIQETGGVRTIVGHAAVFNTFSKDLGGFVELIRPGAFARAIKETDVRGLWNHKADYLLGRTSSGTVRLAEDERGLRYEIDLPDTQLGRDVAVLIGRGDITGSSFGFIVRPGGEKWRREGSRSVRELIDLELIDVSPVTFPAYEAADVALRSLEVWTQQSLAQAAARARRLRLAEAE
ncbi:MAG TPA: HK97 family phage prohead protease [Pirellulales bacterium]